MGESPPGADVDVLLFDLGGVLVDFAGFSELRRLTASRLDDAGLKARWLGSPAVQAFERGVCSADEFAASFASEWDLSLSPEDFLAEFADWIRQPYPGAESLLRSLRGRYVLACLSNSNAVHWRTLSRLVPVFDEVFSSHLLGLVKPDPAVYEAVLDRLDRRPDRVAFFDDSEPNVAAAAAAGMHSYHVRGLDELRLRLSALGL